MLKSILRFQNVSHCLAFRHHYAVDKASLSKLRKRTGISFSNCKKALEQFSNDVDQAEKWLLEQAQKEGWTKATKLGERPMSAGLVGLVHDDSSATMLEVNCETDFVARNTKFHDLVSELTNDCHRHFLNQTKQKMELSTEELSRLSVGDRTVADMVAMSIGNIGENMLARRAKFLPKIDQSQISYYVHASGENLEVNGCKMGKYAAIVEVADTGKATLDIEERSPISEVALQLSRHIVGLNPKSIGIMQTELSSSEEEESEITQDNNTKTVERESTLLDQDFLLDPEITVREMLEENGVEVKSFFRMQCGEELQDDREQMENKKRIES